MKILVETDTDLIAVLEAKINSKSGPLLLDTIVDFYNKNDVLRRVGIDLLEQSLQRIEHEVTK